jgi:inosose dehydratase
LVIGTVRLTAAQALVRFLAAQMTEIDGANVPIFAGVWAIFGHGNVAGLGEAKRPVLKESQWADLGRRWTEMADMTLADGVRLCFHHHMGTVVQSEADIDAMMAATGPSFHLLLDTGHAAWGGADPVALARRYRLRISHFHAKDVRRDVMQRSIGEDWSFQKSLVEGVYTVPSDGSIDFAAGLNELPGYSGWLVVEAEQDPKKAHPLTYAKMGYANLRRFAAEAGLATA